MSKHKNELQAAGEFTINQVLAVLGVKIGSQSSRRILDCSKVTVEFDELATSAKIGADPTNYVVNLDLAPRCPVNWTVVEHSQGGQFEWDPYKVSLWMSEQQKKECIGGNALHELVVAQNPFNANLLDHLLEHPQLIPESWKGKYIFFWGTIYRDADGDLCVRCLYWLGHGWNWDDYWLDRDWLASNPAAVRVAI